VGVARRRRAAALRCRRRYPFPGPTRPPTRQRGCTCRRAHSRLGIRPACPASMRRAARHRPEGQGIARTSLNILLILETERAVEFRSAGRPSAPIFSGNHPHTSTCRFGNCPAMLLPHAHEGSFRLAGSDRSAYRAENCLEVGVRLFWGSCSGLSWRRSTIILGIVVIA